ncbi:uncharacterized protein HGUI_02248 [Hanseniaspora guilliermondii]|uniref:BRCT domain-containing protein n=1 Tax=Hanseniaspora guilliermondii TaxID=56406 RepID=A0A1L0B0W1_9ASCO|nr:uncharacterized protein HGUI_02248 [Hanseniaspora guilliermondii]
MELGNGIANIKGLFKDPFSDEESNRSDDSARSERFSTMEAYRKKICIQGLDDIMDDSELELGEEGEDKKVGLTKILRKPSLLYEERRPVQSILLEEEETMTKERSVSPVKKGRMSIESKGSQKGRKKKMSTTSQVFVKQSLLMNSPEKKKTKRTMSVSFQNEEDNKHQRTLDYYSPKKKNSTNEEELSFDDENKITSGILSGNILSNKDNLSDMKTQETQMLNVDDTEKDEQEIIMSPVMSNAMDPDDNEKSLNMGDTSAGEIISSLGVSEIFEAVQKDRRESEVMIDDIPSKGRSIKMYLAYHDNSMCLYPCILMKTTDDKCVVKNERMQMDWICKKRDIYYYDLKVDTEVHYDRKIFKIQQRERLVESGHDMKTDHLDNYVYVLMGVDGKRVKVGVDMIYLDMNDFSKVEDHLMKFQDNRDNVLTKTHERIGSTVGDGLKGFLFQFSDFDKNKEKEYVKIILKNGGEVIDKNDDIFEDKIRIIDRGRLEIVGMDKKNVPILLIENENYRVTKKLIEFMLLGWPIMRYDVVDRIIEGVDLEKNIDDFEEIIYDHKIIKNYDFSKFLMNYYGNKNNMLLGSTNLRYVRAFVPKKKMYDATKFDRVTSILLKCEEYKVELNDIKLILFYT